MSQLNRIIDKIHGYIQKLVTRLEKLLGGKSLTMKGRERGRTMINVTHIETLKNLFVMKIIFPFIPLETLKSLFHIKPIRHCPLSPNEGQFPHKAQLHACFVYTMSSYAHGRMFLLPMGQCQYMHIQIQYGSQECHNKKCLYIK